MQQHLQTADHPAAGRGDRGGQRRGPRVVDRVQQHRRAGEDLGVTRRDIGGQRADQNSRRSDGVAHRVTVEIAEPGRDADPAGQLDQPGGLVRVACGDGDVGDAQFGQSRRSRPARYRPTPTPPRRRSPSLLHPTLPRLRRRRCCRPANRPVFAATCWPPRPTRPGRCVRRRIAARRICRASSPTPRPIPARNH